MSKTFADLGVSKAVAEALARRGIESPFPVQQLVIEDVLDGRDVLVQSPTGSGKTLAFGVPLVDRIAADSRRPAALILAPTRELARQIVDELETIARARALKVEVVYGGVGMEPQIRKAPKAHILVATPGRLEDLIQRRALTLSNIRTLVLDEADRMLDMGFKPAVDRIVRMIPKQRQTLFFSATLEGAAGELAATYTHDARRHVHAPKPEGGRAAISHRFVESPSQGAKVDLLVDELDARDRGRTLVFVRTKRGADRLVKKLRTRDVDAVAMHGDKSQSQRQKALARFERGDVTVLIATDVAARGIDVAEITHVINFDAPEDGDAYTHRTGRTGRAGATGSGVSFVLGDQVHDMRRMAGVLGLTREFDARDGAGSAPPSQHDSGSRNGGGRNGGGRNGNGRNGTGRNQNGSHRSNANTARKNKQGGGGSTGPKRQRRRPRQTARG
ncbi:MAG TPA: DEAD/DEAH box helicase [Solirubrobacterales bacterium]|nr:DEAD/DEAH box helicase [Solirubrobacterales bacterium]